MQPIRNDITRTFLGFIAVLACSALTTAQVNAATRVKYKVTELDTPPIRFQPGPQFSSDGGFIAATTAATDAQIFSYNVATRKVTRFTGATKTSELLGISTRGVAFLLDRTFDTSGSPTCTIFQSSDGITLLPFTVFSGKAGCSVAQFTTTTGNSIAYLTSPNDSATPAEVRIVSAAGSRTVLSGVDDNTGRAFTVSFALNSTGDLALAYSAVGTDSNTVRNLQIIRVNGLTEQFVVTPIHDPLIDFRENGDVGFGNDTGATSLFNIVSSTITTAQQQVRLDQYGPACSFPNKKRYNLLNGEYYFSNGNVLATIVRLNDLPDKLALVRRTFGKSAQSYCLLTKDKGLHITGNCAANYIQSRGDSLLYKLDPNLSLKGPCSLTLHVSAPPKLSVAGLSVVKEEDGILRRIGKLDNNANLRIPLPSVGQCGFNLLVPYGDKVIHSQTYRVICDRAV